MDFGLGSRQHFQTFFKMALNIPLPFLHYVFMGSGVITNGHCQIKTRINASHPAVTNTQVRFSCL